MPSFTVNIMSHEEDHYFQWQESGHIACHCPNVSCLECDEYSHIVMDCPHRILLSGTPPCHHDQNIIVDTTSDQPCITIMKTGTDVVSLGLNTILTDITARAIMTPTEAIHSHTTGITDDITGVVHDAHTQPLTHIILAMTLHHHRSSTHKSSSASSRDCSRSHSQSAYKPTKKTSHQYSSHSRRSQGTTHTKRNSRVTIDDTQMDYCSLDDHSSNSEEKSDHLN